MSPRIVPRDPSIATINPQNSERYDSVIEALDRAAEGRYLDSLAKTRKDVYALEGPHSFFRDLAAVAEAEVQMQGTFAEPRYAVTTGFQSQKSADQNRDTDPLVTVSQKGANPHEQSDVTVVTVSRAESRDEGAVSCLVCEQPYVPDGPAPFAVVPAGSARRHEVDA
jgi:hypothetical protein